MAEFTQKPFTDNPFSREEERELRESLREAYATDFPNPERQGCPDKSKLAALACRRVFPDVQEVVSHLSHCSPCSQELTLLTRQYRSRQWVFRVAAVALIAVGVAAYASWRIMRSTRLSEPSPIVNTSVPKPVLPPETSDPSARAQQLPEVQIVLLDLRNRGVTRGANTKTGEDLALPKGRLKLSIYLPIGSEEGAYEVRISGRGQSRRAKGQTSFRNHTTVLTIGVDTTTFQAGSYVLAIRQVGWGWYQYPLQVK